jgi:PAS domain S-box-containing protein
MKDARHKILLVEDDELDRMAFVRFVEGESLPYDCEIATSLAEAQGLLVSEHFDVVISDYSLGDGTALDVLELVKDAPVIIITGAGDEGVAVKAWKAGAYDYLIKDLERSYLEAVPITIENAVKYKKAKEQVQLLLGAVTSIADSVYISDLEDKIIFVNKAFCRTYGYEEEEVIGKNSSILWIGKSQSKYTRSVFRTRIAANDWEIGFYHRRKDETVFPASLSRSIIKDSNGNNVAVVGVVRDISGLILVEDRIRALDKKLQEESHLMSELL